MYGRKKKRRIKKSNIMILFLIIALIGTFLIWDKGVSLSTNTTLENIDGSRQAVVIEISTKDSNKATSFDTVTLHISHKYNKGISEEIILTPYEEGKYYYYYIPTDVGQYNLSVYGDIKGEIGSSKEEFTIGNN